MDVKYPEIEVGLVGQNGNAFAILGSVSRALRRAGLPESEVDEYTKQATDGDYNHLLQTTMSWVTVS